MIMNERMNTYKGTNTNIRNINRVGGGAETGS